MFCKDLTFKTKNEVHYHIYSRSIHIIFVQTESFLRKCINVKRNKEKKPHLILRHKVTIILFRVFQKFWTGTWELAPSPWPELLVHPK
jgi:hypothetical protein